MNRHRIIKLCTAAAILTLAASGCAGFSDSADTETSSETSSISSPADGEPSETSAPDSEETTVYFSEDFDPFTDDYDPYGNSTSAGTSSQQAKAEQSTATEQTSSSGSETDASAQTTAQSQQSQQTSQTAQSAQSEQPAQTTQAASSSESGAKLIVSVPNGWSDGTSDFSQLEISVKNGGSSSIEGWTAKIPVGSGAVIDQSWNCKAAISDGVLTVTPVDFNSNIGPSGEGNCGMILKNPGSIDTAKAELICSLGTIAAAAGTANTSGNSGSSSGSAPSAPTHAKDVPAPTTDDWLSVKGNKVVDSSGKEVWLTGVNWFGYNTGTNTFDGLWTCDLNSSLSSIADHGFNLLRVPISAELINNWAAGSYPQANFNQATNSYLVGMNSLEIFDYVVDQCRANGLKIMIDIHSAKTDSMGHMYNVWYNGSVTENDYLAALSWMADRYKADDTIIAYDLKNEPHGKANENPRAKWDSSTDPDNWKHIAEKAAKAVLDKNPNVLVMVEGIEIYPRDIDQNGDFSSTNPGDYYSTWWGGNLRGVKNDPVDLGKYQNKLVYSPHDYGPAVYQQEWFKGDYTYESLKTDAWNDNWLYIHDNNTAPLLIGEWGGFMTQPNLKWMTYLRQLIKEKRLNHTFWCFNANSGDTGGLVKDDFVTWDTEKYEFVKEVLWQEDGKFVGLDHQIPLGSNGKTLS